MFPLAQIHQIEITSRCNLRCQYCVHRSMSRPKVDMDEATYVKAVGWAKTLRDRLPMAAFADYSLNLAGIGESTMHPQFIEYLRIAREVLGPKTKLVLATNGLLVTPALVKAMKPYNPRVYVSLHRPEKAGPAVNALSDEGLLDGVSADPALASTDWAGQIKWRVTAPRAMCPWVVGGWAIVLSDGRLSRCSFDGEGVGLIKNAAGEDANVATDDLLKLATSPYSLCVKCHQDVGVPIPAVA